MKRHGRRLGKTLPDCQQVTNYSPETHYRPRPIACSHMGKDPVEALLNLLSANCASIVEDGGRISNAQASAAAKRARLTLSPKTVSNILAKRHNFTIKTLAGMAAALGVQPWELAIPHPATGKARQQLRMIVSIFASLPPDSQDAIATVVENAARATCKNAPHEDGAPALRAGVGAGRKSGTSG